VILSQYIVAGTLHTKVSHTGVTHFYDFTFY